MQKIKNFFHLLLAVLSSTVYLFPGRKMTVIGITGTDGKTTTASLIYHILKTAGKKVSLISSISAIINGKNIDTGLHVTTPGPFVMQKFFHLAHQGGSRYIVLEVTSHALDQHRTWGTSIDIGIITNVSHEHLDYHRTIGNYRSTKAKILRGVKYSVLNMDDPSFNYLLKKRAGKLITFALESPADFTPESFKLKTKLPGKFNLYNCLAASSVASIIGIDNSTINTAIASFRGVNGRMEQFQLSKNFKIYIDFAHKINALKNALQTARKLADKKLIVVFGCAGLRDRLKRPVMGTIAADLADYAVLTAEDPRTEDVRNIINEIAAGCQEHKMLEGDRQKPITRFLGNSHKYFWRIPDRQEAINFAVRKLAHKGDLILICGKGHEKSMCYDDTEYPWDEKAAVNKALYGTGK